MGDAPNTVDEEQLEELKGNMEQREEQQGVVLFYLLDSNNLQPIL